MRLLNRNGGKNSSFITFYYKKQGLDITLKYIKPLFFCIIQIRISTLYLLLIESFNGGML